MTPHAHRHGHGHEKESPNYNRAFGFGVGLNVIYVVAEVAFGLSTHFLHDHFGIDHATIQVESEVPRHACELTASGPAPLVQSRDDADHSRSPRH